jgi:hypothetical protein
MLRESYPIFQLDLALLFALSFVTSREGGFKQYQVTAQGGLTFNTVLIVLKV